MRDISYVIEMKNLLEKHNLLNTANLPDFIRNNKEISRKDAILHDILLESADAGYQISQNCYDKLLHNVIPLFNRMEDEYDDDEIDERDTPIGLLTLMARYGLLNNDSLEFVGCNVQEVINHIRNNIKIVSSESDTHEENIRQRLDLLKKLLNSPSDLSTKTEEDVTPIAEMKDLLKKHNLLNTGNLADFIRNKNEISREEEVLHDILLDSAEAGYQINQNCYDKLLHNVIPLFNRMEDECDDDEMEDEEMVRFTPTLLLRLMARYGLLNNDSLAFVGDNVLDVMSDIDEKTKAIINSGEINEDHMQKILNDIFNVNQQLSTPIAEKINEAGNSNDINSNSTITLLKNLNIEVDSARHTQNIVAHSSDLDLSPSLERKSALKNSSPDASIQDNRDKTQPQQSISNTVDCPMANLDDILRQIKTKSFKTHGGGTKLTIGNITKNVPDGVYQIYNVLISEKDDNSKILDIQSILRSKENSGTGWFCGLIGYRDIQTAAFYKQVENCIGELNNDHAYRRKV